MNARDLLRATIAATVMIAAFVVLMLLEGCAGTQPPVPAFLTTDTAPVLPGECFAAAASEPKLPIDHDSSDLDATRDREAMKKALRYEAAKRRACADRLKAIFPKG